MKDMKKEIVDSILQQDTGAEAIAQGVLFMLGAIDNLHDETMILNKQVRDIHNTLIDMEKKKPKLILP